MVTIIGFKQVEKEGKALVFIDLQGELRMAQSQSTGLFYMTADKASVLSVFPVEVCKGLIGKQLPGNVVREECDPYQYVNQAGETVNVTYKGVYVPEAEVASNYNDYFMWGQRPPMPHSPVSTDLTQIVTRA